MITLERCSGAGAVGFQPAMAQLPEGVVWIDLLRPTPDEVAAVERMIGVRLPARQALVEIESSSRLSTSDGALFMSSIALHRDGDLMTSTPIGFVLSPRVLVSIRYEDLRPFDDFHQALGKPGGPDRDGAAAFVGIQEAFVDRAADVLESVGADLDATSRQIFRNDGTAGQSGHSKQRAGTLKTVGRSGDLVSQIRDILLGIGRMVPYVTDNGAEWLSPASKAHLKTVRQDVASLNDYVLHLETKVQFLLDATLGFTNVEQNNIFRVLTVVSVVGIPPTLIASMYGMNFKHMPELDWLYGYPYGLTLIFLSAAIPLVLFKLRGWI